MKILFAVLSLMISLSSNSQSSNWQWAIGATGSGIGQEGMNVTTDASGNAIIIGGYADSIMTFGNRTIVNSTLSTEDSYVAKFSSAGNVLWMKSIGGSSSEIASSVCTDANGNVYVIGYSSSPTIIFGNINLVNGSSIENMFLVKYDANGNEIWARNATGIYTTIGYSISIDMNGYIFISGCFVDSMTCANVTLTSAGGQDAFIFKYDPNGNVIWGKSAGNTGSEAGIDLDVETTGSIILTGNFTSDSISFGNFTLYNSGNNDIFIVKYNSLGNVIWAKSGSGNNNDYVEQVSTDNSGNIYITGSFSSSPISFNNTFLNSAGGFDIYIVKYNSTGNVLWAKSAGGINNEYGFSVSADATGNLYLTGGFPDSVTFNSTTITAPAFAADPMFIIKFDSSGNILCADALNSGGEDMIAVSADNLGNAFVSGDYSGNPVFIVGTDTLTSYGLAFLAKYDCKIPLGENELINYDNIVVSPNPFTNQLQIILTSNEPVTLLLYDFLSRRLLEHTFSNSTSINTEPFSNGIYFYEIRNKSTVLKKGKLIKE